jgi:hypothetical protein
MIVFRKVVTALFCDLLIIIFQIVLKFGRESGRVVLSAGS